MILCTLCFFFTIYIFFSLSNINLGKNKKLHFRCMYTEYMLRRVIVLCVSNITYYLYASTNYEKDERVKKVINICVFHCVLLIYGGRGGVP